MSNTICRHLCNSRTELLNYCALGNGMKTNLTSQPYNFQETDRERNLMCKVSHEPRGALRVKFKGCKSPTELKLFAVSSICIFSLMANNPFFFFPPRVWIHLNGFCSRGLRGIFCWVLNLRDP